MMKILEHKKWNRFLTSIKANGLFKANISSADQQHALLGVTMLARQLALRAPEIIGKPNITIAILGSEDFDGDMDSYRALPTLLELEGWDVSIHLVGNNIHLGSSGRFQHEFKESIGKGVSVSRYDTFFDKYITRNGTPDVIIMNSPGIEEYYGTWFATNSGIKECLDKGVKILGCSYGFDEAEADYIFARACGFNIEKIEDNPLFYTIPYKETGTHMMSWGCQTWEMTPSSLRADSELLTLCNKKPEITGEFLRASGKTPFEMFDITLKNSDGERCYWLYGNLIYNADTHQIIEDGSGEVIIEDVELDATYLSKDRSTFTQALLIIAVLRRDYLGEILSINE